MFNFLRITVASVVLIFALVIVHKWLPAGRRRLIQIVPGILVTLMLWLIAGELFGDYLARFAYTYVSYYAGLASAMVALVFLYVIASIFIYRRRAERLDPPLPRAADACAGRSAPRGLARTYRAASITSSRFFSPGRGALTSTAMLPGLCSFFHIIWCARGISAHGSTSLMQG